MDELQESRGSPFFLSFFFFSLSSLCFLFFFLVGKDDAIRMDVNLFFFFFSLPASIHAFPPHHTLQRKGEQNVACGPGFIPPFSFFFPPSPLFSALPDRSLPLIFFFFFPFSNP